MSGEETGREPIVEYYDPDCTLCTTAPAEDRFDWITTHHRYLIGTTELADAATAMNSDPLSLHYFFQCPTCHATVSAFFGARANGLWINKEPYVLSALWLTTVKPERTPIIDYRTQNDIARLEREVASWGGVSSLRAHSRDEDPRLWNEPFDSRPRTVPPLSHRPRGLLRPHER